MAADSKSPVAGGGVKAGGMSKLDEAIARVRECKFLAEDEFKALCDICKAILMEQNNIQPVNAPVTVVGDIHGQFYDMLEMFRVGGEMPKTRYVFLGDFVDRGHHSLETITLLFLYLAKYPGAITLIRGNHESRQVTQVYGFYDECFKKYGSANVWKYCTEVFDYLPLGALIDGAVFCVHGGLSPDITMLDQIRLIERNQEIPHEGPYCDLLWSDPEEKVDTWKQSERGAGWQFGAKVTAQFNQLNDLQLICRAHQLVEEGYKYMFEDKSLITVWSAPNYCYRCGNKAAILAFDQYLDREIKLFKEVHKEPRLAHEHPPNMDYFL